LSRSVEAYPLALTGLSFALLFIIALVAAAPWSVVDRLPGQRPITGLIFTAVLLLGMTAALFPQACSGPSHSSARTARLPDHDQGGGGGETASSVFGLRVVHGHHPSCGRFSRHEFKVDDRSFCVACTGLFAGAALALACTLGLFLSDWHVGMAEAIVPFGMAAVAFGLLQYLLFEDEPRPLRFSLNLLFVLGAFLILAGVEALTRSLTVNLLAISSSILWLGARVSLSRWRHDRICSECGFSCEKRDR